MWFYYMSLHNIKIIFVDKQKEVITALEQHFSNLPNIEIHRGDISKMSPVDCIVAGSNSYGLMDVGIDKDINMLLNNIQPRVKSVIESVYCGEIPVGSSFIIPSNSTKYPFLAFSPSMRIPSDVSSSLNAYHSFRALLTSVINYNKINDIKIQSIMCSCFCTGHGLMIPDIAAKQMRLAYGFVDIHMNCSWENAKIIDKLLLS